MATTTLTQRQPGKEPNCVEIAHRRISTMLKSGDEKYGLDALPEDQAERASALAVGCIMTDGLWISNGMPTMKMEFPLRPDISVTLEFKGRPIQTDIDTLVKVLSTIRPTLPETANIGSDGWTKREAEKG